MALEEGIYFLFEKEISQESIDALFDDPDEGFNVEPLEILKDFKDDFKNMGAESFDEEGEDDEFGLKPLLKKDFPAVLRQTRTIVYSGTARSLFDFESALAESQGFCDGLRELLRKGKALAFVEIWDGSGYWSGKSFARWFNERFPEPEDESASEEPTTATDLLFEFLEEQLDSQENLFAIKRAISRLDEKDQNFLQGLISGESKVPPAVSDQMSARLLQILRESV